MSGRTCRRSAMPAAPTSGCSTTCSMRGSIIRNRSMPPWGKHGFYTEAEIRDMVAFLKTLKTPAKFANPLDDPEKRPMPVEDRDALDPFVNPAAERIEAGAALFKQSCVSCHATPETSFKRWAVEMPKWEPRLKKVLGAEEFITRHAKATAGKDWLMQSRENTDMSVYLHSLANGEAIKVDLVDARRQGRLRPRREAQRAQGRPVRLRLRRLPRPGGQQMDSRPVARRAQGPVRPFPAVAHQPQRDLGHPQALRNGATSRCAPTSCRPMPLNMASSNSICAR